jgi:multidrug efflux pump
MRANPNAVGVNDNWNESVKVLRLDLDQDKMRALGVTSQTVMRAANTILSGTTIGQFREGNQADRHPGAPAGRGAQPPSRS